MVNETYKELKDKLEVNRHLNDTEVFDLLQYYNDCSSTSKAMDYQWKDLIYCKIGNSKIGADTLIINTSTGLNCWCKKNGLCDNAECYACSQERQYTDYLLVNMSNEILFQDMPVRYIIQSIEKQYRKQLEAKKIKYIRWNEAGEFQNIVQFEKIDYVAAYFKKRYGVISYSYSHNKELYKEYCQDIKERSSIILSWSFKTHQDYKSAVIIEETELFNYLCNHEVVICSGNCLNCSYCKNRNDKRPVMFLRHTNKGIEKQLIELLTAEEYEELINKKNKDYALFLLNGGA